MENQSLPREKITMLFPSCYASLFTWRFGKSSWTGFEHWLCVHWLQECWSDSQKSIQLVRDAALQGQLIQHVASRQVIFRHVGLQLQAIRTAGRRKTYSLFLFWFLVVSELSKRKSVEVKDIWYFTKKRWQEYTEELYKKDLHNPDNHHGVITDLEPDILECEVKWALESISMNKASGGDGIPVELFQSWKTMLWKCCTQYASKFGKLSSGHRTGKRQFSFQSQRKAMPKNGQTTTQLHSSLMLVK